jgi:hypothetical protein
MRRGAVEGVRGLGVAIGASGVGDDEVARVLARCASADVIPPIAAAASVGANHQGSSVGCSRFGLRRFMASIVRDER